MKSKKPKCDCADVIGSNQVCDICQGVKEYHYEGNMKTQKLYLAVIPSSSMGGSPTYRLMQKSEIKNIKYYGEYVNLYELASSKPITKEKAKKLGLKFDNDVNCKTS